MQAAVDNPFLSPSHPHLNDKVCICEFVTFEYIYGI